MSTFGFLFIMVVFTLVMLSVSWLAKYEKGFTSFFAAGRNVGVFGIAISTAASWQWADNLFSTSQVGFDYGVFGIAWFAVTTMLSFVIFAFLAERIRKQAPNVLTIPEFVAIKTKQSKSVHISMVLTVALYQLFALALGATATGLLLHTALGFNYAVASSSVVLFALTYSLIGGLKASVITDGIQFVLMLVLMLIMVGVMASGIEPGMLSKDVLFGTDNAFATLFNKNLVIELGIPLAIILLTQPIVDQMIYQRLVALKPSVHPLKPFLYTSLICGFIIVMFSLVGIYGQMLAQAGLITITDSQLTVIEAVRYSMSDVGLVLFIVAFLGVVFSTTDSVYSSIASLMSIDIYKKYYGKEKSDAEVLHIGRWSMVAAAFAAVALAMAKLEILWILFIVGAIGGAIVMPIVFAVFAKALAPRMVLASILLSLVVSVPLSIYANVNGNALLVSVASLLGIAIGGVLCGVSVLANKNK